MTSSFGITLNYKKYLKDGSQLLVWTESGAFTGLTPHLIPESVPASTSIEQIRCAGQCK